MNELYTCDGCETPIDLTAQYCELRDEIAQALYDRDIADGTLHPLGLPPRSVIQWEVIHDLAMFALNNRLRMARKSRRINRRNR